MKLKTAAPLLFLLSFSCPAQAETTVSYLGAEDCPMIGDLSRVTEECRTFRLAFRAEVSACMEQLLLMSRTSRAAEMYARTNRARFLICDAETREKMGVTLN